MLTQLLDIVRSYVLLMLGEDGGRRILCVGRKEIGVAFSLGMLRGY
jgi:hypothetical protein